MWERRKCGHHALVLRSFAAAILIKPHTHSDMYKGNKNSSSNSIGSDVFTRYSKVRSCSPQSVMKSTRLHPLDDLPSHYPFRRHILFTDHLPSIQNAFVPRQDGGFCTAGLHRFLSFRLIERLGCLQATAGAVAGRGNKWGDDYHHNTTGLRLSNAGTGNRYW